jgi:hypothetical protein
MAPLAAAEEEKAKQRRTMHESILGRAGARVAVLHKTTVATNASLSLLHPVV